MILLFVGLIVGCIKGLAEIIPPQPHLHLQLLVGTVTQEFSPLSFAFQMFKFQLLLNQVLQWDWVQARY